MKISRIAIVGLIVALSGCAQNRLLRDGQVPSVWDQQSNSKYIRVIGVGASPQGTRGDTLTKGLAREAALSSARFELAAIIRGIRLVGGTTVSRLVSQHSEIRQEMAQLIAGAVERRCEFASDGGAVVLVEIERAKVQRVLDDLAAQESSQINPESLAEQIKLNEAKLAAMRAKFPGMVGE